VNTRSVDPRTTWAVVVMEAALMLPIMSLPTQGSRLPGVFGPLLLLALLPAGCAAVYAVPALREPSWRLLTGIGLALLSRALVDTVPQPGLQGVAAWLARSVVPAGIGIGLWWRGGALAVAELTPGDVRTEFSIVAVCLLITLGFARPFLLADAALLGCSVALFALGGLIGTALSRQDAAEVATRQGRTLAIATSLLLPGVAILLVGGLRPELLRSMWLFVAQAIELALTPIGLLLAWLASLFPAGAPGPPPVPPPINPRIAPDPALIADAQNRMAWLGTLIVFTLLAAAGAAALLAARLLLTNFIGTPYAGDPAASQSEKDVSESSGTPAADAADVFGWLMRWLRTRLGRRTVRARAAGAPETLVAPDAWFAYQRLLAWADERGLGRRPFETTGQLNMRLVRTVPEVAADIDLLTREFDSERYGGLHPASGTLRRIREALSRLLTR
jgi:uncharacterized protein DUF4129